MSGREFFVEPDRWSLPRRQSVRLRSQRVLPGPLKALPRRGGMPIWMMGAGLGLAGLSVAAAFSLSPRPAARSAAEPSPVVVTQAAAETPTPRVVGAAVVPVPAVAAPAAEVPALEQPASRVAAVEPVAPTPSPGEQRRAAAPALDLGQLPVLELDASAFETAPVAEAPHPPAKAPARAPASRLAGQH